MALVATVASGQVAYKVAEDSLEPVYAGARTIPAGSPTISFDANAINFRVWYEDIISPPGNVGFADPTLGAARRARLEESLSYLAAILNETGTLDVVIEASEFDGTGLKARGGTYFPQQNGFFGGAMQYRLLVGSKQFGPSIEELFRRVDFGFDINETLDPPTPGQFDLATVLLHEWGHALGFASFTDANGSSRVGTATFTILESLVVTDAGINVWTGSPPSLNVPSSELTSEDLFFSGPNATSMYDQQSAWPPMNAPAVFAVGGSLTHWPPGGIVGESILEDKLFPGRTRRLYAPVDIGAFIDIGWTNAAASLDPVDPNNVYVDSSGPNWNGAATSPLDNVADAVAASNPGANIVIEPGDSGEVFVGPGALSSAVRLVNGDPGAGPVRLGVSGQGARSGLQPASSGFVSRKR